MLKRLTTVIVVMVLALGVMGRAHADAAPPAPAPGDSIQTGYVQTNVQMISEDVLITISDDRASVKANFLLRNQGTAEESFMVRFPVGARDGWGGTSNVVDFKAFVDNQAAAISMSNEPFPYSQEHESIPWANWLTTFPPGQTISLDVYYQLLPDTAHGGPVYMYDYILETGAGWFGTIGQGTITVRLPYEVNDYNIHEFNSDLTPAFRPALYTKTGTDIVWTFSDLDPTRLDNILVMIIEPPVWREVLEARNQVESNPNNAESHARLGRAYRRVISNERGYSCYCLGPRLEIANMGIAEYEAALALDPNNVLMNVHYAELLVYVLAPKEKTRAALTRALELAPDDDFLNYAAARLDSTYSSPTLSAEDIKSLRLTPTVEIQIPGVSRMTRTPSGELTVPLSAPTVAPPTLERISTPASKSNSVFPIELIAGIGVIGAAVVFGIWWRRRAGG